MPTNTIVRSDHSQQTNSRSDWRGYAISATIHAMVLLTLAVVITGNQGIAKFVLTASQADADAEPLVQLNLETAVAPAVLAQPIAIAEVPVPPPLTTIAAAPIRVDVPGLLAAHATRTLQGTGHSLATVAHSSPPKGQQTKPNDKPSEAGESDAPHALFFGTHAYGNQFVYILDASPSMVGNRYQRACDELIASLTNLQETQSFYVFLFSWRTQLMFDGPIESIQFIPATDANVDRFRQWLYMQDVRQHNGTDPRVALDLAERLRPDAAFLLSDGEFNKPPQWNPGLPTRALPQHSVSRFVQMIYQGIPLHCIAFEIAACEPGLRALSELTGGTCRFVPRERPDADQLLMARIAQQLRQVDPQGTGDSVHAQQTRLSIANSLIQKGLHEEAQEIISMLSDKRLSTRLQRKLDSIHRKLAQ